MSESPNIKNMTRHTIHKLLDFRIYVSPLIEGLLREGEKHTLLWEGLKETAKQHNFPYDGTLEKEMKRMEKEMEEKKT
jgi:hypothetical protein